MNNVIPLNVSSTSTEINPALRDIVQGLFDEMLLAYGKKFVDTWSATDPDKLVDYWARQLVGYTPRELKRGIAALETRDWPPSAPEFKKMCRPPIDPLVAYYEAVAGCQARSRGEVGDWSYPAIYWAASPLSFDLLNQGYTQIKARWESGLAQQIEKGEWEPIPKPMIALVAPGKGRASREEAAKALHQIGASGVLRNPNDTAWYRKILARVKAKDPTVTMIQRQFAEKAAAEHGYQG